MWNIPEVKLTAKHKRTLRKIKIDAHRPGPIVHDMEALMGFVAAHELRVSKKNQLLPRKVLADVNALMAHPIEVRLKRPQLGSYPHIEGLYLLLRATGLGQIAGPASKPILTLNQALLDSWSSLNLTERYISLLETWVLDADPQIIGSRFAPDPGFDLVRSCLWMFESIPSQGLDLSGAEGEGHHVRYSPGLMSIALLELFGLLAVEQGAPQEGKGWQIARLRRVGIGEAVFAVCFEYVRSNLSLLFAREEQPPSSEDTLRSALQPYFADLKRRLEAPVWAFREGTHVFKVSLGRALWRRIAIQGDRTLDTLADAILRAYDFDHDHLYRFSYRNQLGATERAMHPWMDEGPWASEVRVGDVPLPVGQNMDYLYDFGDSWQFSLTLERVDPPASKDVVILDRAGEAPEQYPSWEDEGDF